MNDLEGIAKKIFEEVMEEIEEEIIEGLESYIVDERLEEMIKNTQNESRNSVLKIINENYSETMNTEKKLILGEKMARVVTSQVKKELTAMLSRITENSFNLIEEMRKEIIDEVFEETE